MSEDLKEKKEKFDDCDCGGTAATPWDYCDDCNEYQNLLEQTFYTEEI